MKPTTRVSRIKTIRKNDKDFLMKDGTILCPRAGFEISKECPQSYQIIIKTCLETGWLNPVAHMMDDELMWDRLKG